MIHFDYIAIDASLWKIYSSIYTIIIQYRQLLNNHLLSSLHSKLVYRCLYMTPVDNNHGKAFVTLQVRPLNDLEFVSASSSDMFWC